MTFGYEHQHVCTTADTPCQRATTRKHAQRLTPRRARSPTRAARPNAAASAAANRAPVDAAASTRGAGCHVHARQQQPEAELRRGARALCSAGNAGHETDGRARALLYHGGDGKARGWPSGRMLARIGPGCCSALY